MGSCREALSSASQQAIKAGIVRLKEILRSMESYESAPNRGYGRELLNRIMQDEHGRVVDAIYVALRGGHHSRAGAKNVAAIVDGCDSEIFAEWAHDNAYQKSPLWWLHEALETWSVGSVSCDVGRSEAGAIDAAVDAAGYCMEAERAAIPCEQVALGQGEMGYSSSERYACPPAAADGAGYKCQS